MTPPGTIVQTPPAIGVGPRVRPTDTQALGSRVGAPRIGAPIDALAHSVSGRQGTRAIGTLRRVRQDRADRRPDDGRSPHRCPLAGEQFVAPRPAAPHDAPMRSNSRHAALLLITMTLPTSSCSTPAVAAPGQLAHTVYFWLKPEAPADTAAAMVAFYRTEVAPLPGVVSVLVGEPRKVAAPRDVVDASYTLGVTTVFASATDEDVWQTHPVHQAFLERFGPSFAKVQVYDTLAR